jgi:nucleotide-binding universal stress UspA family protein
MEARRQRAPWAIPCPFIDCAESVEVISIAEDEDMPKPTQGAEIAPHLMRHGVHVTIADLPRKGSHIGAILAEHALAGGGDLLVMGGSSRSPQEAILGGTARYILDQLRMPVLLSH